MYFDPISRRCFLKGAGASLILPFLPSVMSHAQTSDNLRYVQVFTPFGQMDTRFWPSDSGMRVVDGVHVKDLTSINGELSRVLGSSFNSLKGKMSVIRGLNVLAGSNLHNGSFGSCGSGTYTDNFHNGPPVFPWSVDAVLSQSSKVYPNTAGIERFVNFAPVKGIYTNFSWWRRNGKIEHLPLIEGNTGALLAKFSQLGNGAMPAQDPRKLRQTSVIDDIFEQYRQLRDSGKLSQECKNRLEAYTTMIREVERDLSNEVQGPSCDRPGQVAETNEDARHRNQIKIAVAALACGLTKVASYSICLGNLPMHSYAHEYKVDGHANRQRGAGEWVAFLISEMDKMPDINGTLLDNSLVYWGNEYGDQTSKSAHSRHNMPVVLAGGGGKIRTGYFVDYNKSQRRPFNNLLVTLFNVMGLSSSDYERENVVGFGEYNSGAINGFKVQNFMSMTERRKPLPFIYTGQSLG